MFDKVNLSPLAIRVLTYLSRSPDRQFYVREIAAKIKGSVGGCHKVLGNLYEMDLIARQKSGRNLYYKVNERNPAITNFKIFVNILELKEIVKNITSESNKVILYGSCATGEDTLESDIDIVVITENVRELKQGLKNRNIGERLLKPIILSPHEIIKLKDKDRAFYNEINKGIVLWRAEDERV